MTVKGIFHGAVRKGHEKEGWVITDDLLKLQADEVETLYRSQARFCWFCCVYALVKPF